MPRAFVIHLHTGHGPPHYDLMFQFGEALATWRVATSPGDLEPGESVPATQLPDHRLAYLTYEGPVSRGRGHVRRVDTGTFEPIRTGPSPPPDPAGVLLELRLAGEAVRGRFRLARDDPQAEQWTLTRTTTG